MPQPTETYRLGATEVWQVRSCCWNFNSAPIGFLHVRVGPSGLAVRETLTGAPALSRGVVAGEPCPISAGDGYPPG